MLVLSLFPGIGLLDRAFEEEGFCVVRGPDLLWGGDIRRFHPPAGRFDGVIGGPPCQSFSKLGIMAKNRGQAVGENMIPEFERVVAEAAPHWFLMENVPAAPAPTVPGYHVWSGIIDNRAHCGGVQHRERRWSWGTEEGCSDRMAFALEWWAPPMPAAYEPTITANGSVWDPVRRQSRGDHNRGYLRRAIRAQGLPEDFTLPAFTVREAVRAVGNGVPLPMGRAVARAVKAALA